MTTLCLASVPRLRQWLQEGFCSAREVVQAHIDRLQQTSHLNAVVLSRYEEALEEADRADRRRAAGAYLTPLHGIPITIKECLDLAGTPSTFGLEHRRRHRPERDDPRVTRLRAAGAIVLGKTNLAQALLYTETDNPVYGRTLHPKRSDRTPGGSSGGEAAAIAVGGSVLGLGTDIAGSCRVPAHFSGVVGFKPTTGLLPDPGRFSIPLGQRAIPSSLGMLARDVDSLLAGLEVVLTEKERQELFSHETSAGTGYFSYDGLLSPSPAVRRATEEAALACQAREWTPPDLPLALRLFYQITSGDGGTLLRDNLRHGRVDPRLRPLILFTGLPRGVNRAVAATLQLLAQPSLGNFVGQFGSRDTATYWKRVEELLDYRTRFLQDMPDIVICPPHALPALPHGASKRLGTGGCYAPLANIVGCPAGVVPWTRVKPGEESHRRFSLDLVERSARKTEHNSAGLPVGVQVIGKPGCDSEVLRMMRLLERYREEHSIDL